MRLMSPRSTAPYHTLECAPSVTSPMTVAVLAMKTFLPSAGFLRRNLSSCFASLFTRKIYHEAAAAQIERKRVDREIREIRENKNWFPRSRIWRISRLKKRGAKTLEKLFCREQSQNRET